MNLLWQRAHREAELDRGSRSLRMEVLPQRAVLGHYLYPPSRYPRCSRIRRRRPGAQRLGLSPCCLVVRLARVKEGNGRSDVMVRLTSRKHLGVMRATLAMYTGASTRIGPWRLLLQRRADEALGRGDEEMPWTGDDWRGDAEDAEDAADACSRGMIGEGGRLEQFSLCWRRQAVFPVWGSSCYLSLRHQVTRRNSGRL